MKELEVAFQDYEKQVRRLASVAVSRSPGSFVPQRYRPLRLVAAVSGLGALFCWGSNLAFLALPLLGIAVGSLLFHEVILRKIVEPELRYRVMRGRLDELMAAIREHQDLQRELVRIQQSNPLFLSYDLGQPTSYPRRKASRFDWTSWDELKHEGLISGHAETAKALVKAKAESFK